jgi:AraC family transcriptional regulator, regulatory protein of adaptative response / methylated-DNA-[protein]-cysteine methyltransferase
MREAEYRTVERAIRYLQQHSQRQPRLAEVAAYVGRSEFHFQRLFRRWAGLSPKRYLQFLTAGEATRLLRRRRSALDVTLEVGLSSPSRLHDLLVHADAVTPGEVKRGGEGLEIVWGFHPSPFGECLVGLTARGVCELSFVEDGDRAARLDALRERWPGAELRQDASETAGVAGRAFSAPAGAHSPPIPLHVRGTNFQLKVWNALLRLPPGEVTTYGELARSIAAPGSARAVGGAVGDNVIACLIPCHRVIRSGGGFGGYRWGVARKRAILDWEGALGATVTRPPGA